MCFLVQSIEEPDTLRRQLTYISVALWTCHLLFVDYSGNLEALTFPT